MEKIENFAKREFSFLSEHGFSTPQLRTEFYGHFLTFAGKIVDLVVEMDSRDNFYGVAVYPTRTNQDLKSRVYFRMAVSSAARLGLCELPKKDDEKNSSFSPEEILTKEAELIRNYLSVVSQHFSEILAESKNPSAFKPQNKKLP